MKFKYIGEKKEMKDVYGYDFSDHAIVDAPDSDALATKKLSANSHFMLIDDAEKSTKAKECGKGAK